MAKDPLAPFVCPRHDCESTRHALNQSRVDLHEVERLLQRAEIGRALAIIQRATGSPETKGASND